MNALIALRIAAVVLVLTLPGCSREEPTSSTEDRIDTMRAARQARQTGDAARSALPEASSEGRPVQSSTFSVEDGADSPVQIDEVSFDPAVPVSGDSIRAVVVFSSPSVDGRRPKLTYRWKINGRQVQESGSDTLSQGGKRDDYVEAEVMQEGAGSQVVSRYVMVANAPPALNLTGQNMGADGRYEAKLEARDPEQDAVVFSLKSGPPGLAVDPRSGLIQWAPGSDVQGTFSIEVSARDVRGAETLFSYQIKIRRDPTGKGA